MNDERDYQKDLEICEKATPGEWTWNDMGDMVSVSEKAKDSVVITIEHYDGPQIAIHEDNDTFITTARTALPWYIRRCMDLESDNGRLREALEQIIAIEDVFCTHCQGEGRMWADGKAHYPTYTGPTIACPQCGGGGSLPDIDEIKEIAKQALSQKAGDLEGGGGE